eukprot:tig00021621_g22964.t1
MSAAAPAAKAPTFKSLDGNEAAASVAYAFSDIAFIYPITPSSPMAEHADEWSAMGKPNLFGQVVQVKEMESEAGAAGALHGALAAGALGTTFTASQGLLLMIPNMYKIAGELMPCVMHVAARSLAGQALCIFGDHSDVMAVRQTGWALLSAATVQEAYDLAIVSHLSTLKSRVPFVHFFDGFRTSHEVQKIDATPLSHFKTFMDMKAIEDHRGRALNPAHPHMRGTAQGSDVFFQNVEAANQFYDKVPAIVEQTMNEVASVTGRPFKLVDYYGAPDAELVIVSMGSSCPVIEETIDALKGQKIGLIKIRLFRPWPHAQFLETLPKTTKRICVLDRTKEAGAQGEPIYLDVCTSLHEGEVTGKLVVGGRYGLGSKEFTPSMVKAIYDNLALPKPKNHFTVGIVDDVTHTNLPLGPPMRTVPEGTVQCQFWGMGSDGTVGANKDAVKIIGDNSELFTQAYFSYDAHKSGGLTVSHLRFGPKPITSTYLVTEADYVAVHLESYVTKYNFLATLRPGGAVVLNTVWTAAELEKKLPASVKRQLHELRARLYIINARAISDSVGLGKRINMVMQTVFFYLSGVLPFERAIALLKKSIEKTYGKKGPEIVAMNHRCVDAAVAHLVTVPIPDEWKTAQDDTRRRAPGPVATDFVKNVVKPMLAMEGDSLPVSAFVPGGVVPPGTTQYEKRAIASKVPTWKADKCSQCNYCAFVCPHAAIRPVLVTEEELEGGAPEAFETRKAKGSGEITNFKYRVQVSPYDCTGCELCIHACPDEALEAAEINDILDTEAANWDYFTTVPPRGELFDRNTVKGSQFQQPLLEFSGACEGCGETPYVKLLTQLFGERMIIANATGCSSIWSGSAPVNPYTTNKDGRGPAWANSLFEDNAQFGYGIATGVIQRRAGLRKVIDDVATTPEGQPGFVPMSSELRSAMKAWLDVWQDADKCESASKRLETVLGAECRRPGSSAMLREIYKQKDLLTKASIWIVGGDGWAYDIGYGGLDHVLASGENVNILVMDTEMYSNTGGQQSKSTPMASVAQFAMSGKKQNKKDLGILAMQYGSVYVASVALGANFSQVTRAMVEAERYPGVSLIIAYAPCMLHGIREGMSYALDESKMAVDTGYWTLYRFDPRIKVDAEHTQFQLDSKKIKAELTTFLKHENRFGILARSCPSEAKKLQVNLQEFVIARHEKYKHLAETDAERKANLAAQFAKLAGGLSSDQPWPSSVTVAYGSQTGNAEGVAHVIAGQLRARGVAHVKCCEANDLEIGDLPAISHLVVVVSTAGQGEQPDNIKDFWKALENPALPADYLANTTFAVFGLGDSSYCFFCKSAIEIDERLGQLGAQRVLARGIGDDQDEDKYETGFSNWVPELYEALKLPEGKKETGVPNKHYKVVLGGKAHLDFDLTKQLAPTPILTEGCARHVRMLSNGRLTSLDYDRNIRHMVIDLEGSGLRYGVGDALAIYPRNAPDRVADFLGFMGLDPLECIDELQFIEAEGQTATKQKPPVPAHLPLAQLFTDVLDLFGRPSKRFYERLALYASDPAEKAALERVCERSAAGGGAFAKLLEETPTYADVIRMYPSTRAALSIEHLVDILPVMKPRYYSIASSPHHLPGKLELCIVVVDWKTKSGADKFGTCTGYLKDLLDFGADGKASYTIAATMKPSAGMCMPAKPEFPVICAGLGTGLAPMRAMVQERLHQIKAGKKIGETVLFFGCRFRAKDYLYGEEWEQALKDGNLTHLRVAFSRDQKEKIYIQNKIEQEPALIADLMLNKNGYFFFCGPARQAPNDIRAAMEKALQRGAGLTEQQAAQKITELIIAGRYVVEAWS